MIYSTNAWYRRARLGMGVFALLGLASACDGSKNVSPSSDTPQTVDSLATGPADSATTPADSLPIDTTFVDTTGVIPASLSGTGITFGIANMPATNWNSMYNGSTRGVDPNSLLAELQTARAKGGRLILRMAGKSDDVLQNPDGTFSLAKWQAQVDRFRVLALESYIVDGTLMGHFLIDEPQNTRRWGGKPISQTTVEAMARYSKQLWPGLTTFARVVPSWLAQAPITYTYLDAGWLQEATHHGAVTAEAAAAKLKGLGLIVGLNILGGGNGSSKVGGFWPGKWAMSASEIRTFGIPLLSEPRACGFSGWTYLFNGGEYLARPDIHSAMVDLSNRAKAHPRTSCRQ